MSSGQQPNVLLVMSDQHRHDWVGTDSAVPVRTPNFDALSERGVRFTNAVCPSPVCAPSRSCLASGMEYGRCGVSWNADYPLERKTYYRRLRDEADYAVLGAGDIDLHMNTPAWGLDGTNLLDVYGFSEGVEIPGKYAMVSTYRGDLTEDVSHPAALPSDVDPASDRPSNAYMAFLESEGLLSEYVEDIEARDPFGTTRPAPLPHDAYVDNWVGRRGLELLESAPADQPWHLAVNFVGPHPPVDVSEEMHGWYRNPEVQFPEPTNPGEQHDDETHQAIRRNYAAMVENIDRWLGKYVDALRDRGELENTVVVYTSDHGEHLGDNSAWTKHSPRHQTVSVPLAVAGPGVESRAPVDDPATTLDLHATVLDYADVLGGDTDSRSLRPFLEGETTTHRDAVRSGLDPWRVVFDGRHKLIVGYDTERDPSLTGAISRDFSGDYAEASVLRRRMEPVLFDRREDPEETTNVAAERPDIVSRLAAHLPDTPN
jgi:choline-sulfatase